MAEAFFLRGVVWLAFRLPAERRAPCLLSPTSSCHPCTFLTAHHERSQLHPLLLRPLPGQAGGGVSYPGVPTVVLAYLT